MARRRFLHSWAHAKSAAVAAVLLIHAALGSEALAQDGTGQSLSQLRAPVCMSDEELTAYLTLLALATSEEILARCKASFPDQLDGIDVAAIETANRQVAERPGEVMSKARTQALKAFERAHPGKGGGVLAEVIQGDLANNMRRARSETLKGCEQVVTLWSGKIGAGEWEQTLALFGANTLKMDNVRRRRSFQPCP